jgi:hypothetical protein
LIWRLLLLLLLLLPWLAGAALGGYCRDEFSDGVTAGCEPQHLVLCCCRHRGAHCCDTHELGGTCHFTAALLLLLLLLLQQKERRGGFVAGLNAKRRGGDKMELLMRAQRRMEENGLK